MTKITIASAPFNIGDYGVSQFQYLPRYTIGTTGPININAYTEKQMTKTTITVRSDAGTMRDFEKEDEAMEFAQAEAHRLNATTYLVKVYKIVKPKREVTVEDVL